MVVDHVLLDADGVMQYLPGGWLDAVEPFVGERTAEFLDDVWTDEKPSLRGDGDFLTELGRALEKYGVEASLEELYPAVWHSIHIEPSSIDLVHRLRAAGYGVHLGTNQEQHRSAYMRSSLGYDDLFDVSCYSCELGVAKPDSGFFQAAVALIGAEPDEILFIDDNESNVRGARTAGLAAEHWHLDQGLPRLLDLMAPHGVLPG